ncbi:MAG: CDP-alcohol phosphatidyltransferase family protein [Candidatus Tectomicrobia bacterium]|uniref:CDP-alcohol phosphatidyltransferase family protein n=1 Tax=Tectimicrobiota bacterium TaxID=2528274 RepID=A0A932CQ35_UNCTE|nr:CDP-alcohol phosphatidyltransferase family protein [Candidatus Tectomicrobia bacterium]
MEFALSPFKKGVNPNTLTLLGFAFSLLTAFCIASGRLRLGGLLILLAGGFDVLDGAVARIYQRNTRFGVLLDAVMDRYSDLVVYVGLIIYYAQRRQMTDLILICVVLIAGMLIPYIRARAETLMPDCSGGLMERPERVLLLSAGLLFNLLSPVLWILAVLGHITVFQRLYFAWQRLNDSYRAPLAEKPEELHPTQP